MAVIERIDVQLATSTREGAGTDGDVFIGIAGREFYIESEANDFEAGSNRTYRLGDGANILYSGLNDPRAQQLQTGNIEQHPVYVRFEPKGAEDNWNLWSVAVTVNPGPHQIVYRSSGSTNNMWLGPKAGKFVFLSKSS